MATKPLSSSRKDAMAQGRRETNIVKRYLALVERQLASASQRSEDDIQQDLETAERSLLEATGVERLDLLQQRENLQRELLEAAPAHDAQLEEQFIAVAKTYGTRKEISYSTWREFGVSKAVLEAAGIPRTRRPNQPRI